MAISIAHHRQAHAARVAGRIPTAILAMSVAPLAFDLLARLQHVGVVASAVPIATATSAAALAGMVFRRPGAAWLWAACTAYTASAASYATAPDLAALLGVLGVLALGAGGAFSDPADQAMLVDPAAAEAMPRDAPATALSRAA